MVGCSELVVSSEREQHGMPLTAVATRGCRGRSLPREQARSARPSGSAPAFGVASQSLTSRVGCARNS